MHRKLSSVFRLTRLLPLLVILAACATGAIREKVLTLPVIEGADYVGQETCMGCHEDSMSGFASSIHGRLADFEFMGGEQGCESCHGPGSLHVESDDYGQILKFGELTPDEAAAVCTKCHSDGDLMGWTMSEHSFSDISCADCHQIHWDAKTNASLLKKSDPELCYTCHQEQRAKANFPSHHPVAEGKMNCSSCHNVHGEVDGLATNERGNDLCLDCHSRYQGPFVFEHAPVQEDCTICHDPHGTVANNLLVQNEPFLCLQCHENHFHAAREGAPVGTKAVAAWDGDALADLAFSNPDLYAQIVNPADPTTAPAPKDYPELAVQFENTNGLDSWRMGFNTKCTVCHSVVHGSDLPSQTAPVIDGDDEGYPKGGAGLTR